MLNARLHLLAACAALYIGAQAPVMAQAIPQTHQKVVNGTIYTETYGYLDPRTCVIFAAPELVRTNYRTWYERWVLVPSGHFEPVAATLASQLTIGGQVGWRIPSMSEVVSYKQVQPYLDAGTLNIAYWSTDTLGTQVSLWRVASNTTLISRSGVYAYLWPVRDAVDCSPRN